MPELSFAQRFWGHLKTITLHKFRVMRLCFRLGLYRQGLLHDCSKYSLTEFIPGVRYFQGTRSPIDKEKEMTGLSRAWLHHKGRNYHHWEYWLDKKRDGVFPLPIPYHYLAEMFADRVAACMTYQKEKYTDASAYDFFMRGTDRCYMHPDSSEEIKGMLLYLKENGLNEACRYIKQTVKEKKNAPKSA